MRNGQLLPLLSPAGTSAMRGGAPGQEGGSWIPKEVSMVHAVRNRKVWGRQRALWVAACGVWDIGVSILRSVCEKVQVGVPNHHAEEGREIGDLRSPWASCLVLFPGPNHGSLSNPGGVQAPGAACAVARPACTNTAQRASRVDVSNHPALSDFYSQEAPKPAWEDGWIPGLRKPKGFLERLLETIHEQCNEWCNAQDFAKCSSPSVSLLLLQSLVSFHWRVWQYQRVDDTKPLCLKLHGLWAVISGTLCHGCQPRRPRSLKQSWLTGGLLASVLEGRAEGNSYSPPCT